MIYLFFFKLWREIGIVCLHLCLSTHCRLTWYHDKWSIKYATVASPGDLEVLLFTVLLQSVFSLRCLLSCVLGESLNPASKCPVPFYSVCWYLSLWSVSIWVVFNLKKNGSGINERSIMYNGTSLTLKFNYILNRSCSAENLLHFAVIGKLWFNVMLISRRGILLWPTVWPVGLRRAAERCRATPVMVLAGISQCHADL